MKKMVVEVRTAHRAVTTALSPTSVNTMSRAHAPPRSRCAGEHAEVAHAGGGAGGGAGEGALVEPKAHNGESDVMCQAPPSSPCRALARSSRASRCLQVVRAMKRGLHLVVLLANSVPPLKSKFCCDSALPYGTRPEPERFPKRAHFPACLRLLTASFLIWQVHARRGQFGGAERAGCRQRLEEGGVDEEAPEAGQYTRVFHDT